MKKVFISVGVRGLNLKETNEMHEKYREKITEIIGDYEDISIKNTFKGFTIDKPPIYWLGKGLMEQMSKADIVIFCGDISVTRGCKVEKLICELYNIPHLVIEGGFNVKF